MNMGIRIQVIIQAILTMLTAIATLCSRNSAVRALCESIREMVQDLHVELGHLNEVADDHRRLQVELTDATDGLIVLRERIVELVHDNDHLVASLKALDSDGTRSKVTVLRLLPGIGKPQCDQKIACIKAYRNLTDASLKPAKFSIEDVMGDSHERPGREKQVPHEAKMRLLNCGLVGGMDALKMLDKYFEVRLETMSLEAWNTYQAAAEPDPTFVSDY